MLAQDSSVNTYCWFAYDWCSRIHIHPIDTVSILNLRISLKHGGHQNDECRQSLRLSPLRTTGPMPFTEVNVYSRIMRSFSIARKSNRMRVAVVGFDACPLKGYSSNGLM